MRWWGLGLLGLLALSPIGAGALEPGQRAPSFTLKGAGGEAVQLEDFRGEVVLLNFWASWCKPCLVELPRLEALHARHRERGFTVLAVNLDSARNRAKADALRERLGLSFPVVYDPKQDVASRFELERMPSSFLIDRAGVIRYVHPGFEAKDEAIIAAKVERALSRSERRGTPPSASE